MKPNRILRAAGVLCVLVAATAAFVPGATMARYTAGAEVTASARVAMWWPFSTFGEHEIFDEPNPPFDPADDNDDGPITVLLSPGQNELKTIVTLVNRSEVTARYILVPDVDEFDTEAFVDKEAFLEAITIGDGDDYDGGIVVPIGQEVPLDIEIPAVRFKGLKIDVIAEQAD